MKNYQNARILHNNCSKNIFPILLGEMGWGTCRLCPAVFYAYAINQSVKLGISGSNQQCSYIQTKRK